MRRRKNGSHAGTLACMRWNKEELKKSLTSRLRSGNDMKITQLNIPTHQMNTKFVNNLPALWCLRASCYKDSQETRSSLQDIVDPLAYVAHTTSAHVLPSPSTLNPQPTAQSPNDALMATMTQIANLLSGFQKQFPPTNNQLRTSSNSKDSLLGSQMSHCVTEPAQRKAQVMFNIDTEAKVRRKQPGEHQDSDAELRMMTIRYPVSTVSSDTEAQNVQLRNDFALNPLMQEKKNQLAFYNLKEKILSAEKVSSNSYLEKANTHSRTAYTEKLSALTAGNNQLKAQVTGKTSSGLQHLETHNSLPIKSANARRVEAHHRTLNKKNRVDSNLLVKHSVSVSNLNNKEWKPIKRVWKPISKPVANSKPQWKPTGRHFSLFEKYPLTRIMESTDMPIELPPSASSSPKITMVSRFTDHKLSKTTNRHSQRDSLVVQIVLWNLGILDVKTYDRGSLHGLINFVKRLKHNLFSVGQSFVNGSFFEVAFRQHHVTSATNDMLDLLKGSRQPTCTPSHGMKKSASPDAFAYKSLPTKIRTDNGTEFVNKTLDGWFESVGISHETSVPRSPQQNGVVERRNRTLMEAARTMLIFAKAPLFLWAEAVATACYTLNRSLVHTLHGKTYYELLKGKKPNLQYFRVFGSLCYPTNDYDDVGKLKAKADIGIFVGYAPTKKAYRIYNKRTRKIQETVHVAFDELTEGLTSVQTSSGLAPQQMTSVPNSTELELTALQSGRSRSALVKDPEPPSVPPTKKQVDDLFQWFDDDEVVPIPPVVPISPVHVPAAPAPENANGSPSTTVISEGGPAVTENLLPHQIPLPDTSDSDVETLFDHVDSHVFDTHNAPETDSEASHSNSVNIDVTPNNQLPHVQKWTQAHPLENIIGDKDRPVSTRKQLETDAMWCFFNEFLTHVEPKTYKQALESTVWIEANAGMKFMSLNVRCLGYLYLSRKYSYHSAQDGFFKIKLVNMEVVLKNKVKRSDSFIALQAAKGFVDPDHPSHVSVRSRKLLYGPIKLHVHDYKFLKISRGIFIQPNPHICSGNLDKSLALTHAHPLTLLMAETSQHLDEIMGGKH
ncbi:retrovirus-related pol polyprotein from transposon TNT 1-94 [Tanacetum coccineum]